ncbi:PHP domain-containing protein [Actinomyces minihominis]|uniref:PHP domain-containing protein n=1 Tax=Actinomyces minihominis TaxID=2002838 RepID=UPI000C087832|nr:PHP domain-containing protein [Actinomyces minihominis]
MPPIIDLHTHTNHSDGTDSPEGLIFAAQAAGLDVIGVTDHDSFGAWAEATKAAVARGVNLVRGAEISAAHEGHSVHVLGFLMDPEDQVLNDMFDRAKGAREVRLQKMVANLMVDFPLLSWDSIAKRAGRAVMGRPHLADELVENGYFPNRNAAFEWALHPRGPYFVPQPMPTPVEVVTAIRNAGGVPVLAHPFSVTRKWMVPDEVIAAMAEAGLFGIERDHRDHDPEGRLNVERLAADLNLKMTGGSDYHGTGKPNSLGENLTEPYILAEIEKQGNLEVVRS